MPELVWDGKYKDGKKVAPVRIALPFQTIETVNESAQERRRMLDFFSAGHQTEWRNRLIWGDKKYVLPSLLEEFAGKVNLIYIDPPFATGANFSFTATVPPKSATAFSKTDSTQHDPEEDNSETQSFTKEPGILEQKAYRDTWGKGLDSFLQWMYETLTILRDLLAEDGCIYLHCDYRTSSQIRMLMDEVFGVVNFVNEIIWYYKTGGMPENLGFGRKHDNILFYTKSPSKAIWNPQKEKSYLMHKYGFSNIEIFSDANGQYTLVNCRDVFDIPALRGNSPEKVTYPTQKPEALLERVVRASSNAGDLVLDCFCGSGTTAAVAEKLGRRWIACDLGRFAIHTTRKRLLSIAGVKPFVVQNLGKYERQAWQAAEFDSLDTARAREAAYRRFILDLYKAEPVQSGTWLHGARLGRMVHVGAVDAPVTLADVRAIARETWARVGSGEGAPQKAGVDILGWDFAFEHNELGKQIAQEAGVDVKFKKIPREVLEKKAVDQGDIRFFELAALSLEQKVKGRKVELSLSNLIVPPDDVPQDVMKAISHWSQLVDYWAVDWNFAEDTFHNEWQAYRSKKNPKLELKAEHTYEQAGTYTVLVKVIDLLGNDTTKAIQVEVK